MATHLLTVAHQPDQHENTEELVRWRCQHLSCTNTEANFLQGERQRRKTSFLIDGYVAAGAPKASATSIAVRRPRQIDGLMNNSRLDGRERCSLKSLPHRWRLTANEHPLLEVLEHSPEIVPQIMQNSSKRSSNNHNNRNHAKAHISARRG
ncbi:hypothetical protein BGZ63DRAFT_174159 [Mariannaea sp. PMI_226]|nr:hypothetical protein BGZ63DRAFT_174159 [Mariannaea sp. PMI_226]